MFTARPRYPIFLLPVTLLKGTPLPQLENLYIVFFKRKKNCLKGKAPVKPALRAPRLAGTIWLAFLLEQPLVA